MSTDANSLRNVGVGAHRQKDKGHGSACRFWLVQHVHAHLQMNRQVMTEVVPGNRTGTIIQPQSSVYKLRTP